MSITDTFRPLALAASMALAASGAAFAQSEAPNDPPGRVGRLSHMEGAVSFRTAEEDQWVAATLNFPVTTGDSVWTEPNARAEIQIGSTDLRLDPSTAVHIARLDDATTQIQVDQGSINLRVRELPPGGISIQTPRAMIYVLQPGRYHVDEMAGQANQPTDHVRVAVLDGLARLEGAGLGAPLTVSAGHSATLRDNAPPLLAQALARPLDTWALERERLLNPQETVRYVSPEMTGYQDLERYGQWTSDPTYGAIWYPRAMVVDWAPYRYGHWAYVRPWGWTWIDHEPWGFAPFHYGRWVRLHDRWGWYPGERVRQPVYAPALVAFIGGGNFLISAVGWVPLAPREAYRPHYRHSAAYVRNVNITTINVTNVTVINRDRSGERDSVRGFRNREGLTVVSSDAFTGAAPIAGARVTLRDNDVADARRTESLDHLRPSRAAKAGLAVPTGAVSAKVANTPDVLPPAPGPSRDRRRAPAERDGRGHLSDQSDARQQPQPTREPTVSPFDRQGRAAPAMRTAPSNVPALRSAEPPRQVPNPATGNEAEKPARGAFGPQRTEGPRTEPRAIAPVPPLESAPHTVAPTRPAPLRMLPAPMNQSSPGQTRPSQPDVGRPAAQPMRRDEPRINAGPRGRAAEFETTPPRAAPPGDAAGRFRQRPPDRAVESVPQPRHAPSISSPAQPERDARREPVRPNSPAPSSPAMRAVPAPQQPARPAPPTVERRPQPRPDFQRSAPPMEPRREARPQPSAPREMSPRRIEQPSRPRSQDAKRPSKRKSPDELQQNGG